MLLGKPPKMTRDVQPVRRTAAGAATCRASSWRRRRCASCACLRWPDKTFLISIGDRTVGGLCSRDPFVGPWQVPVADVAVTLMGFNTYRGEAMAMGERTPLALIDPPASGRMAVGEAMTNIAAARIDAHRRREAVGQLDVRRPAIPARTPRSTTPSTRSAMELCPALGISIPVGKDSMSMKSGGSKGEKTKQVTAPLVADRHRPSPPCLDARWTLTPAACARWTRTRCCC